MYFMLLVLPLPVLITLAFYLNRKKQYKSRGKRYVISIMDGLGTYLILSAILSEGFFVSPILQFLVFIAGLIVIFMTNNKVDDLSGGLDVQIESNKNLFVLFSSTILLFYILLSVFRYQPAYLQILLASLVTILFNGMTYYMKKLGSKIYDQVYFRNSRRINFSAWYLYVFLALILLPPIFLNFPKFL